MNFLAHGEVARRLPSGSADLTLGAMLPDLAHMLDFSITPTQAPQAIRDGWECHLTTDKWFHSDDRFRSAVSLMSAALSGKGWSRWPAQAAAHVSWELMIDGHLARSADPTTWYEAALSSPSFRESLDGPEQTSWDRLVDAQTSRPLWRVYMDPAGVADRTWRRLAHTRLAFPFDAIEDLVALLNDETEVIAAEADDLLDSAVLEATTRRPGAPQLAP
jgi:hypothetical protein